LKKRQLSGEFVARMGRALFYTNYIWGEIPARQNGRTFVEIVQQSCLILSVSAIFVTIPVKS